MSIIKQDFGEIGSGVKKVEGSFTSENGVTKSITVDGLTTIHSIEWVYSSTHYGIGVLMNQSTLFSAYNRGSYGISTGQGVMSISDNAFGFLWNDSIDFTYTAYGE